MDIAIVVGILTVCLFAVAFFTKRRFGTLGLGLTAGATLSALWAKDITPYVQEAGLQLVSPPLQSVVGAGIILLPAVILLFGGPKYSKLWQRIVGAAAFALLTMAFWLGPLEGALVVIEGDERTVYDLLVTNQIWIITGGILYALIDIMVARRPKKEKH